MAEEGLSEADRVELGFTGRLARELSEPVPLISRGPAVVLVICNQKGGVGKTTPTINLGAVLAELGRKVLLVDLDPQDALSIGLDVPHGELNLTVYNLIVDGTTDVRNAVHYTKVSDLNPVPTDIDPSAAEIQLVNEVGREQTLGRALRPMMSDYDSIIIDCQPLLGLLTVNVLTITKGVIIPMMAEYLPLCGLALLIDTVAKIRDRPNFNLGISGILVTMFGRQTCHAKEVMERLIGVLGDKIFNTVIIRTVHFPETPVAGEPITTWAPNTLTTVQYRNLAREAIERKGRE